MAKYTNDDPDIQYLDKFDQINYNFDMLKYDVDKYQEPYVGAESVKLITNPNKVGEMFKSPVKFTVGVMALVSAVLVAVLIIYIIVYILLRIFDSSENLIRRQIMEEMFIYFLGAALFIILAYWLLNKVVTETTATGFLAK